MPKGEWRVRDATPQENAVVEEVLSQQRLKALAEWKSELQALRQRIDKLLEAIEEFKLILA